ncbi:hypothetical protein Barb4_00691 [Bacteroidales bacterium Barb4]|nr:hypothetical protein Barb4_00691 [Bacteroidales bacterium Barb4]
MNEAGNLIGRNPSFIGKQPLSSGMYLFAATASRYFCGVIRFASRNHTALHNGH